MGPKAKAGPSKGKPKGGKVAKDKGKLAKSKGKGKGAKNKGKGKRGGKKAKPQPSKPPPIVVEPVPVIAERERKPGRGKWTGGDFVVICALFSYEALNFIYDALHRTGYNDFSRGTIVGPAPVTSALVMLVVIIGIIGISFQSQRGPKFWRLVVGLYIYAIGAICGIVLALLKKHVFVVLVSILQIAWYVVNPLRYFVIFHQRWPIQIKHTRLIVSVNLLFIGLVIWFSVVFIEQKGLTNSTTLVFWIALLVAMLLWMIPIHVSYSYLMEKPIELEEIANIYKYRPAAKNFEHRNKQVRLFALILVPIVTFALVTKLVNVGLLVENYSTHFYQYRYDLLIAAIAMGSVKLLFQFRTLVRHEMEDLTTILIALVLNAIAILFMLLLVMGSNGSTDTRLLRSGSQEKTKVSLLFTTKYGLVTWTVDDLPPAKMKTGQSIYAFHVDVEGEKKLSVEGKVGGRTLFKDDIVVVPSVWEMFCVPDKETPFVKLLPPKDKIGPDDSVILLYNFVDSCDQVEHGLMNDDKCQTVEVTIDEMDKDENPVKKEIVHFGKKYDHPVVKFIVGDKFKFVLTGDSKVMSMLMLSKPKDFRCFALSSLWADTGFVLLPFTVQNLPPPQITTTTTTTTIKTTTTTEKPVIRKSSILPIVASTFNALSIGAARASYLHLIWILSPFKGRILILAGYCVLIFASEWVAFWAIRKLSVSLVVVLLIFQMLLAVLHFVASVNFKRTLPPMDDTNKSPNRDF